MNDFDNLARYDPAQSYDWNYHHAPEPIEADAAVVPGGWRFCGLEVDSPLGIPAGPLLNGRWVLYYAALGFDLLTYKTVRSAPRTCYPMPNLQPVRCGQLAGGESQLPVEERMGGSWAVSFGMPSKAPDVWREDVEHTRGELPPGKLLSVSVVGTIQDGWTINELADDYARCARWAVDSGADAIETNFSCPNVSTRDGQLYQQPADMQLVAQRVRDAIGDVPFVIKIGQVVGDVTARALLDAVGGVVDGLAMTNSIAARVATADGRLLFDGEPRGICGDATREASTRQTALFARLVGRLGLKLSLIGVGGASSADHVRAYLAAGAESVHLATAAMIDPTVALRIRRELATEVGQGAKP